MASSWGSQLKIQHPGSGFTVSVTLRVWGVKSGKGPEQGSGVGAHSETKTDLAPLVAGRVCSPSLSPTCDLQTGLERPLHRGGVLPSLDSGILRAIRAFRTLEGGWEDTPSWRPSHHIYYISLDPEGMALPEPLQMGQLDSQQLLRASWGNSLSFSPTGPFPLTCMSRSSNTYLGTTFYVL